MSIANRRQVAQWANQYLSGALSLEQLFDLLPHDTEDEQVSELLDLIEHEPKRGGFMGTSPEEHGRHMGRIRELVNLLAASRADSESAG